LHSRDVEYCFQEFVNSKKIREKHECAINDITYQFHINIFFAGWQTLITFDSLFVGLHRDFFVIVDVLVVNVVIADFADADVVEIVIANGPVRENHDFDEIYVRRTVGW